MFRSMIMPASASLRASHFGTTRLVLALIFAAPAAAMELTIDASAPPAAPAPLRTADLPDSSLVSVHLGGNVRRVVVASPRYLADHPRIDEPADLARHQIVAFTNLGLNSWSFTPAKGSTIPRTIQFNPRLTVNTVRAAVASAVAGRGLTRL